MYNDFGQAIQTFQAHDGEVDLLSTPSVQMDYADGSDNTTRQVSLTYPNGRVLTYAYGTTGGIDDVASRIVSIIDDDSTHLVDYEYLGQGTFVTSTSPEPGIQWTLVGPSDDPDTGDIYTGLDRLGRIKDNRWHKSGTDLDRIKYGYDRASNRIWRENPVATANNAEFDELYTYDGVQRLKDMARGTLNSGHTALTSTTFGETWTLDETGNWSVYTDANGSLDETFYSLTDITYNVVAITDATGAVAERFLYAPYGKSIPLDAGFAPNVVGVSNYDWEYRFTSREFDKETGLDYFRRRYYASNLGRFINRDPLGYPNGYNLYAAYFVPNKVDPSGLAGTGVTVDPKMYHVRTKDTVRGYLGSTDIPSCVGDVGFARMC